MKTATMILAAALCFAGCKETETKAQTAPAPAPATTPTTATATATASSTYEVFPGCDTPAATYARTLYFDATKGSDALGDGSQLKPYKTLTKLAAVLKPGDHVIFAPGSYGYLQIKAGLYAALVGSSTWVWLDFQTGAKLNGIDIRDVSRVLVTGGDVQRATGVIVGTTNAQQVVVADMLVSSSYASSETLTVSQWLGLGEAVTFTNGQCLSAVRMKIKNVRFGFQAVKLIKTYPANAIKALFADSTINGFSADATRALGSDVTIKNNKVLDGYADISQGDGNHDDMFQGFANNGNVFENVTVEGNWFQDRSKQARNLVSNYQGIAVFDGLYRNVKVLRNVIIIGAYHGINMAGLDTVLIDKNTLVSSFNGSRVPWIATVASKTGVAPKANVVSNNLAPRIKIGAATTNVNNFIITNPVANYVTYDLVTGAVDLHLKTTSPAFGKGAGVY